MHNTLQLNATLNTFKCFIKESITTCRKQKDPQKPFDIRCKISWALECVRLVERFQVSKPCFLRYINFGKAWFYKIIFEKAKCEGQATEI